MVKFLAHNIRGGNCLSKTAKSMGGKSANELIRFFCKILSFLTRVAQKVFNRPGSY